MLRHIICEATDFGKGVSIAGKSLQIRHITTVHPEDEVEPIEVIRPDLASDVVKVVAVQFPMIAHSGIWQLPFVPRTDTCGIHFDVVSQLRGLENDLPHNLFRGGRTADIAETDEKETLLFHLF